MPFSLEAAQFHVDRFEFEKRITEAHPDDRGKNTKIDSASGHWSAGTWSSASPHYTGSVLYNQETKRATFVQTLRLRDKCSAVWFRNTNMPSFAIAALANRHDDYGRRIGVYNIQDVQLYLFSYAFACLFGVLGLDPFEKIKKPKLASNDTDIWAVPGSIEVARYDDHAFYAQEDGYFPARTDIGRYNDVTKTLIGQWREWMKAGKIRNRFVGWLV